MKHGCRGLFGSGSVSSPSISFLCDEGTGLFVGSQKGTLRGTAGGIEILALNGTKIAIGQSSAGQEENTIVLNATGSFLDTASSGSFHVAPIKTSTEGTFLLKYDSQTKEVLKGKPVLQVQANSDSTQVITDPATVLWPVVSIPNGAFTYGAGVFTCVTPCIYQFCFFIEIAQQGTFADVTLRANNNGLAIVSYRVLAGGISTRLFPIFFTSAFEQGDELSFTIDNWVGNAETLTIRNTQSLFIYSM